MDNFTLEKIISTENIILAIEKTLNANQNAELRDFYDVKYIYEMTCDISFLNKQVVYQDMMNNIISKTKKYLNQIYNQTFDFKKHFNYYRRPKSINNIDEYRPLVALDDIYLEIAVNAINIVIFDRLSSLIPASSYGNVLDNYDSNNLYKPYFNQYKKFMGKRIKFLGEKKYNYILLLDIRKYYERISFNSIKKIIYKFFGEDNPNLLKILLDFYASGCDEAKGLPQGVSFSHFFASLLTYDLVDYFKSHFSSEEIVYYVDDINVFFNAIDENDAESKKQKIVERLEEYFNERLYTGKEYPDIFNSAKTSMMKIKDDSNFSEIMFQLSAFDELRKDSAFSLSSYDRTFLKDNLESLFDELKQYIEDISSKNKSEFTGIGISPILEKTKRFYTYREILLSNSISELEKTIKKLIDSDYNNAHSLSLGKRGFFDKSFENYIRATISICSEFKLSNDEMEKFLDKNIISQIQLVFSESDNKTEYHKFYLQAIEYLFKEYKFLSKKNEDEISKKNRFRFSPKSDITNLSKILGEAKSNIKKGQIYYDFFFEVDICEDKVIIKRINKKEKITFQSIYRQNALKNNLLECLKLIFKYDFCTNEFASTRNKMGNQYKVYEYRLLNLANNSNLPLYDLIVSLIKILDEIDENYYDEDVDPYIESVMKFISRKIRDNNRIDSIILTHHYVRDLWKNGARDLPFFTLHNQEHSIELILKLYDFDINSLGIATSLLNEVELYVLIMSIYLHDLGMLYFSYDKLKDTSPDELSRNFELTQTLKIAKEYSDFLNDYNRNQRVDKLIELYNIHKIYRSKLVRDNHAYHSRMFEEINTLICSSLGLMVKIIGNNHGVDVEKMQNQDDWVDGNKIDSIKLSHYLRFLDGLDTSRRRVSLNLYNFMNKYVSEEDIDEFTMTHWAKHLITEDVEITRISTKFSKDNQLFDYKSNINKTIILTLKFNETLPLKPLSKSGKYCVITFNENNFFKIQEKKQEFGIFNKFINTYFEWTLLGIHELNCILVNKFGVCIQVNFTMPESVIQKHSLRIYSYLN